MTEILATAAAHYRAPSLAQRLDQALAAAGLADRPLTVQDTAAMDHFHTRGLLATKDLAAMAGVDPGSDVLDIGSGVGGPARFLAANYGANVIGVDLSPDYVEAADYLSMRCGLSDQTSFRQGDALKLSFEPERFDRVFLQHVAMNIADREQLYAGVARVLRRGGRFGTFDIVRRSDDPLFPVPWAREAAGSYLLTEDETIAAAERAGLKLAERRDETQIAIDWFGGLPSGPPATQLTLGLVLGPEAPTMVRNLRASLSEGRIGVLMAVFDRP